MEKMENMKSALVVQSNKLIEASYRLRIGQQKFLRLMASRIKKDDEDLKSYEFKVADIMELFNTKNKSNYSEIPRQIKELMGNVLTFKEGKRTTYVPFLALAENDEGSGILSVQFHPVLKSMYICLNKENPFTIYELSNTLKLRSIYSLRFYELLKQYQKIGSRVMRIEDIRKLFELTATEYIRYNDFKRKIIFQAQKELKEKTDIYFEFEEMKTVRKVTSLKFYIKTNKSNKSNIKAIDEICVTSERKCTTEEEKCSTRLINEIKAILEENITGLEAKSILDAAKGDINTIKEKYNLAKNVSKIDNIVGWILKALKEDYQIPKGKIKAGGFNDYEQRAYDFDALEKKLLGWDTNKTDDAGEEYQQGTL